MQEKSKAQEEAATNRPEIQDAAPPDLSDSIYSDSSEKLNTESTLPTPNLEQISRPRRNIRAPRRYEPESGKWIE